MDHPVLDINSFENVGLESLVRKDYLNWKMDEFWKITTWFGTNYKNIHFFAFIFCGMIV